MTYLHCGKVAGIQICISFWLIVLSIIFFLAGMGGRLLIILTALCLHECAHIVIARMLKFNVAEIELLPFGCVAKIYGLGKANRVEEIMIAGAGPIMSLLLAGLSFTAIYFFLPYQEIIKLFYEANLMLAVFNMMPALPLDGGRIVRAWLASYWGYLRSTKWVVNFTRIGCVILILWTLGDFWFNRTVNITFILAVIFLVHSANLELGAARYRSMTLLAEKKQTLVQSGAMMTRHITALPYMPIKDIVALFTADYYYIIDVLDDNFHIQGMVTETELWEGLQYEGITGEIGDFFT